MEKAAGHHYFHQTNKVEQVGIRQLTTEITKPFQGCLVPHQLK